VIGGEEAEWGVPGLLDARLGGRNGGRGSLESWLDVQRLQHQVARLNSVFCWTVFHHPVRTGYVETELKNIGAIERTVFRVLPTLRTLKYLKER